MKFADNWLAGMSSSIFCGGFSTVISITTPANYEPCTDIEDRAKFDLTYPYSWLLAKNAGYQPSQGSHVRKNGHEDEGVLPTAIYSTENIVQKMWTTLAPRAARC